MNTELLAVLDHLTREKGIDREVVIEAVEAALISAARKVLGPNVTDVSVEINRSTGAIKLLSEGKEISISKGGFGRIAAQTAKQVIFHKIREAERNVVFNEYSPRANTLLSGTMHRFDRGAIIVDLGKAEAILPKREQSPKESFRPGDQVRAYCIEVNKTAKGPQIVLSRSHPNLVRELFLLEVPEISQGIIEIKAVSREAGDRTKIAVISKDERVDCVGACVGMRGTRVKDIVRELHGEKIDIIRWSSKLEEYVSAALAPAKVAEIRISDDKKRVEVIVDDDQLSLAIGKRGQNVRLAAKLTGMDIDVRSHMQVQQFAKALVSDLPGVGPKLADLLKEEGLVTIGEVVRLSVEDLTKLKGVGPKTAEKLIAAARERITQLSAELESQRVSEEKEVSAPVEGIPSQKESSDPAAGESQAEESRSHEAGTSDKVAGASGAASDSRSQEAGESKEEAESKEETEPQEEGRSHEAGASDKVAGASGAASDSRSQEETESQEEGESKEKPQEPGS